MFSSVRSTILLASLVVLVLLLTNCQEPRPVVADFLIDTRSLASSEREPTLEDTAAYLRFYAGDDIYLAFKRDPEVEVSTIKWDIDGDGKPDQDYENHTGFSVKVAPGWNAFRSWANDGEQVTTKWVYGEGEPVPQPSFSLLGQADGQLKVSGKRADLQIQTQHITGAEQVQLQVEDQAFTDFTLDEENGLVEARIPLAQDLTFVTVSAPGGDGLVSETFTVRTTAYDAPVPRSERKRDPPPPPPVRETEDVAPPPPPPPATSAGENSGRVGLKQNQVNAQSCDDYSVSEGFVQLKPRTKVYLESLSVYASSCGKVVFTISLPGQGEVSETRTILEGLSQISFNKISDVGMVSGGTYKLSYKAETTANCSTPPMLLNAASCGLSPATSSQLTLNYGAVKSLFSLSYAY